MPKMHWDYLKTWTNFRRQLVKRHVTQKIIFHKNKEITQNSPETALVWIFVISLTYSGHWNKTCVHCSSHKPIFIFLTSILRYHRFMRYITNNMIVFRIFYLNICSVCSTLKHQSQQKSSAFVVCCNVLDASWLKWRTRADCSYKSTLIWAHTLVHNVSKNMQNPA